MGMPYAIISFNGLPYIAAMNSDLSSFFPAPSVVPTSVASSVAISPDGVTVVAATENGTLYIYEMTETGLVYKRTVTNSGIVSLYSLVFSPDGTKLLGGHWGNAPVFFVWDTNTWAQLSAPVWTTPGGNSFNQLDWSSDGSLIVAACGLPTPVLFFRASDMSAVAGLNTTPTETANQIKFSDDNKYVGVVTAARTSFHRVSDRVQVASIAHPVVNPGVSRIHNCANWKPGTHDFVFSLGVSNSNSQVLAQFTVTDSGATKSLPDVQATYAGRNVAWTKDAQELFLSFGAPSNPRIYRYSSELVKQSDPAGTSALVNGAVFDIVCGELPDEPQTRPVIFLTG